MHFCEDAGYESLPIRKRHIIALESLAMTHSDPFDRILVSQAKAEGRKLLTRDAILGEYWESVEVI